MSAPRTSWKGSVSFGLVNVPIALTSAVTERDVKFSQFTADLQPVGRQEIIKETGEPIQRTDIKRGYKLGDEVILVEDEELEALAPVASRTIEIEKFVAADDIDPLYYSRHQFVVPQPGGEKGYGLLVNALSKSGKVGIARVVMRSKQHVVAIRSVDGALCVTFLNYDDEVRGTNELDLKLPEVRDAEVDMAVSLIDMLAGDWNPSEYKDEHRERVLDMIQAKANGTSPTLTPITVEAPRVDDIMAALAASVEASRRAKAAV